VPLELTQSARDGGAVPMAVPATATITDARSAYRRPGITLLRLTRIESCDQYDSCVPGSRLPHLPTHLVHDTLEGTVAVIVWLLVGFILTALGGWTASRATTSRRVSIGMALTLAVVIVCATGIWYHTSMPG